ncbi:MAG: DUF169 domain-containing protein [Bacteroidetes bacterium]|nr:DUF169 domain-containing protein [Bacteroidota bacterium]
MNPNPKVLLEIAGIDNPLIGLYDVPDLKPFEPLTKPKHCFFSAYKDWLKGDSICISVVDSNHTASCQGGGYWIGNVLPQWIVKKSSSEDIARENFATGLNQREGFKSSDELMRKWLDNLDPYRIKNKYVVIGPLKEDQYNYLKTITFYVNPDQLSLLIHGAEYNNAFLESNPVITAFGSGCGQLAALLGDLDTDIPKAVIGATDMAMREHLPPDILAFTVNKPMYRQLCELDENSFLYKHFWSRLKNKRENG